MGEERQNNNNEEQTVLCCIMGSVQMAFRVEMREILPVEPKMAS